MIITSYTDLASITSLLESEAVRLRDGASNTSDSRQCIVLRAEASICDAVAQILQAGVPGGSK